MKQYINGNNWYVTNARPSHAKRLIESFHYSKSFGNVFTELHGLFYKDDLYQALPYGVCVWIPPTREFNRKHPNSLVLSRLVLSPDAPKNSATFMLSRSIKMLPDNYDVLVTYADPSQGHEGTIYKASNWKYDGMSTPEKYYTDANGAYIARRRRKRSNINNGQSWDYSHDELLAMGCTYHGKISKHRFIYFRPQKQLKKQPIQLSLFSEDNE